MSPADFTHHAELTHICRFSRVSYLSAFIFLSLSGISFFFSVSLLFHPLAKDLPAEKGGFKA